MAISENPMFKKTSGHVGKSVVFKQYGEKTVVSKYPDMSKRKLSEKQVAMNETFMGAIYTAKHILANEELRNAAQIRLNVTRNKLYSALIREYIQNEREASQG
jgi:hypothetical protein